MFLPECLGVLQWTFECTWLCRLLIQMAVINDTWIYITCLSLFNVIHNLTQLACMLILPNMLKVFLSSEIFLLPIAILFLCAVFQQLDPKSCMHAGKWFSCLLIWQFWLLWKFMFGMLQTGFGNVFLFCVTFCCCCWAFYLIYTSECYFP